MIIDHIGIAVKSIEKALFLWERVFGYHRSTDIVTNIRQSVNIVFLDKEDSVTIKLLEPIHDTSPIFMFVKRGGGLHHLCFKCDNLDEEIQKMQDRRLRILTYPESGEAFENEKFAFVYAGQGLNVELIDTDKRAKRRDLS